MGAYMDDDGCHEYNDSNDDDDDDCHEYNDSDDDDDSHHQYDGDAGVHCIGKCSKKQLYRKMYLLQIAKSIYLKL